MLTVFVDLSKLQRNLLWLKSRTKSKVCAVVKADAYGHGLKQVAFALAPYADELAVATADEAALLARLNLNVPIIVLGAVDLSVPYTPHENVYPTVSSSREVAFLRQNGFMGSVNLAVNTGMNRLGCLPKDFESLLLCVEQAGLGVKSAFTHFYNANDPKSVRAQIKRFSPLIGRFSNRVPLFHCCASSFLFLPESTHLGMVRPGLALYGCCDDMLESALSVSCPVMQVNYVQSGEHVGYGDYVAENDCTVATLRIGYGDGYRRRVDATPRYVSVGGALCPVLGQVCMDMTFIDVTGLAVRRGDTAVVLGEGVTLASLAASYQSIEYEVLTAFASAERAERIYIGQEKLAKGTFSKTVGSYR